MIKIRMIICWVYAGLALIVGIVCGHITKNTMVLQIWFVLAIYLCFRAHMYLCDWKEKEDEVKG